MLLYVTDLAGHSSLDAVSVSISAVFTAAEKCGWWQLLTDGALHITWLLSLLSAFGMWCMCKNTWACVCFEMHSEWRHSRHNIVGELLGRSLNVMPRPAAFKIPWISEDRVTHVVLILSIHFGAIKSEFQMFAYWLIIYVSISHSVTLKPTRTEAITINLFLLAPLCKLNFGGALCVQCLLPMQWLMAVVQEAFPRSQ